MRILEHDAATIDLPDASVDVVVSNLGVNNFHHPHLNAVAKEGGELALTIPMACVEARRP